MAHPKITARVTGRHESECEIPLLSGASKKGVKRSVSLRLSGSNPLPEDKAIELPADYFPTDVMVGDEFEVNFFHVRRPKEAADALQG